MHTFNIWDAEALEFDSRPDLFVNQESDPIIWTVRGIKHFSPRFQMVGVSIHAVQSRTDLEAALRLWHHREAMLLERKIRTMGSRVGHPFAAHRCLSAILDQNPAADDMIASLERCTRTDPMTPR